MEGEFVRFHYAEPLVVGVPVPITLYTAGGDARPLRAGEFFYLTDLSAVAPPPPAIAVLFDDIYGDQSYDSGNILIWLQTQAHVTASEFIQLPARFSAGPWAAGAFDPAGFFKFTGHGIIRGA